MIKEYSADLYVIAEKLQNEQIRQIAFNLLNMANFREKELVQ